MADSGKPAKTEAAYLLSKRIFANFAMFHFLVGAIEGLARLVGSQTLHSRLDIIIIIIHVSFSYLLFFPTCVVIISRSCICIIILVQTG